MLALRCQRRGSLAGLSLDRIEDPVPGPGELLIRVRWASVNPIDWKLALAQFDDAADTLPRGAGSDYAGEILAAGEAAGNHVIGARVFGCLDPAVSSQGTMAEFVTVPADTVFYLPDEIPIRDAAALACAGFSARQMCELGAVAAGRHVLINGASGGVGHLAVQLAKRRGAVVTAVASARRKDFVLGLGADEFLDYGLRPIRNWPTEFDTALDCVPNLPREVRATLLRPLGHYVRAVPESDDPPAGRASSDSANFLSHGLVMIPTQTAADELLSCYTEGHLRVFIESEYSLSEAIQALERSMSGRVQGKLLVKVA